MMVGVEWTLEELVGLAARALASAEVRAASGRVTGVPDARLVRWYTTIGLLDRPVLGANRVARYGPRHLLQLVAVKRLQAQGLPLAQVQARLAGATDAQLRAIAEVDPEEHGQPEQRFWARRPVDPAVDTTGHTAPVPVPARVHGLRLGGLTLLLPVAPAPHDLDDIAVAARPLLELLAARGLLEGAPS